MRQIHRLTATTILSDLRRGFHSDGAGLNLQVSEWGTKSWVLRYQRDGKARMLGLGPVVAATIAEAKKSLTGARERAHDAREMLARGIDPIDAKRAKRVEQSLAAAKVISFDQCADDYLTTHSAGWDKRHGEEWKNSVARYVRPMIGKLPVAEIDTALVLKCLQPIWQSKQTTAHRLRGRIESVLDFAKARGCRDGENPARLRGHLENLLPKKSKAVENMPALPYAEIPAFMAELRGVDDIAARALDFCILTAVRSNKIRIAKWDEIDLATKTWSVAKVGKDKRGHVVPLCDRAIAILRSLPRVNDYVFPGKLGPIGEATMWALLKRLRPDLSVHGFRSTFRDWCGDQTNYPREICEHALGHVVGNETERAYRRGTAFSKRAELMAAWCRYCSSRPVASSDNIVQIGAAR
jgi:integrase